jgi:hypothetical protein
MYIVGFSTSTKYWPALSNWRLHVDQMINQACGLWEYILTFLHLNPFKMFLLWWLNFVEDIFDFWSA